MDESVKEEAIKEAAVESVKEATVTIRAPDIRTAEFMIRGTAPLVVHAFSAKARAQIRAKQEAGSTAASKRKRDARDFSADLKRALHVSTEGWYGVNAMAFKHALVSACRTVGFKMTLAKLGLFIEPEGFEKETGVPLIQILSESGFEESVMPAPNTGGGFDLRIRPMWREWRMKLRISYDADMFTLSDVANLLMRAGRQVGIGEGRPDSKKSVGQSWGTFVVVQEQSQ
jgi:hypothetical protein